MLQSQRHPRRGLLVECGRPRLRLHVGGREQRVHHLCGGTERGHLSRLAVLGHGPNGDESHLWPDPRAGLVGVVRDVAPRRQLWRVHMGRILVLECPQAVRIFRLVLFAQFDRRWRLPPHGGRSRIDVQLERHRAQVRVHSECGRIHRRHLSRIGLYVCPTEKSLHTVHVRLIRTMFVDVRTVPIVATILQNMLPTGPNPSIAMRRRCDCCVRTRIGASSQVHLRHHLHHVFGRGDEIGIVFGAQGKVHQWDWSVRRCMLVKRESGREGSRDKIPAHKQFRRRQTRHTRPRWREESEGRLSGLPSRSHSRGNEWSERESRFI